MASAALLTISEDLSGYVDSVKKYFRAQGYQLSIEPSAVGFPFTPLLTAKRAQRTLIVELVSKCDTKRCTDWYYYCKGRRTDTRFALCVPADVNYQAFLPKLADMHIGLYTISGNTLARVAIPHDLAVNLSIPPLAELSPTLRKKLGDAYEKFENGDWREGFEDACKVLERSAAKLLWDGIRSGQFSLQKTGGKPRALTKKKIDKLTLGDLGVAFEQIVTKSTLSELLAQTLPQINPDRIGVVHKKHKPSVEAKLRQNVDHNMWRLVACLRTIFK